MARASLILVLLVLVSCSNGETLKDSAAGFLPAVAPGNALAGLPVDGVQPWETVNAQGYVIPARGSEDPRHTSAFPASSEMLTGAERFLEGGNVTDNGSASTIVADGGPEALSWAMYRLPLAGAQPGALAVDANLLLDLQGKVSQYWVGVSDYGNNRWQWHGPFREAQVTQVLEAGDYTSPLGNAFIAVAAYDGAQFDVVGVLLSQLDSGDTTAPPVPSTPVLTPVAGGVELSWTDVLAADLAGYHIYYSYSPFTTATDNGVQSLPSLENTTRTVLPVQWNRDIYVALSAVDVHGNESALSANAQGRRLSSAALEVSITVGAPSAQLSDPVTVSASGADLYDFDTDGDGVFDITGSASNTASVDTSATGIIRPRVRGTNTDGTAVAFGSVSLIVSGNQRPVANAQCTPQTGTAPLSVTMNGTGEDFDGTIAEYAWDFDGDGIYDHNSGVDGLTAENYTSPGLFNAKLRVTDNLGAWDVDTISIYITDGVRIDAQPGYANPGQLISLTATPNGDGIGYEWDLDGNGSYETDTGGANAVSTSLSESGDHIVGVQVEMSSGPDQLGSTTVRVRGWRRSVIYASPVTDGETTALAMVGGRPAVAFGSYTVPDGQLLYMRADDAEGTSWSAPVVVNTVSGNILAGVWPSLEMINGRPAICAADFDGVVTTLKFWRADDATGNAWSSEVALDNTLATVGDVKTSMTVLESVPPVPAVSYRNPSSGTLYYVRANDADGAVWAAPQTNLDPTIGSGLRSTLLVVQGNPAIGYERSASADIYYVRANDAFGVAWGAPVAVATGNSCNFPAMLMADGRPAIMFSYSDGANVSQGRFILAGDDVGSMWGPTVKFYDTTYYMGYAENIGGLPFVLFTDLDVNSPVSCTALRTDGLAWDSPLQMGPINSSGYTWSLAGVNGQAAFTAQTASGLPSGLDVMYSRLY